MPNLLNENTISELFGKTNIFSGNSLSEVKNFFKVFQELSINPDFLEVDKNGFISINELGAQRTIPVRNIFELAKKLKELKSCKGFDKLSESFNNPTQFSATVFEVHCAHLISTSRKVVEVELSPEVIVNRKIKYPDFRFLTASNLEVICECKSLDSVLRVKQSRVFRLINQMQPYLKDMVTDKFRIEIAFKVLPPHWNRNYCEQLAAAVQTLIKNNRMEHINLCIDKKYETNIKICVPHEELYFKQAIIRLANEKSTLVISELTNLQPDIKNSIKDACTQLPNDKASAIFLYSINEYYAKQAITNFFANNKKKSLCGIFSWTTGLNFYHNPNSIFRLSDHLAF